MKLKEKKNILNMTFDNMNMSDERSDEIIKELINYNSKLENKEEKNMKEKKVSVGENLHEISPKDGKSSKWQYVLGSLCVLAVAALGIFIWKNAGINHIGNNSVAGTNVKEEETTTETLADNNTGSFEQISDEDTVYYVKTGNDEEASSVIIPSSVSNSSNALLYAIGYGNISVKLMRGYNYNIYRKETDDGLEVLALGVRKEGNTYYYVYSKQIQLSGINNNDISETTKAKDGEAVTQKIIESYNEADFAKDGEAETQKFTESNNDPDFVEVSFTADEKYIGRRDELIEQLSSFYDIVNEFIDGKEPYVSYNQRDIEGELGSGKFEYQILKEAEASYVTCGIIDPIASRLNGYFMYLDGEIGVNTNKENAK